MIGSSRWCRLLAILCVTAISLQLLDVADGQAYHFSKGWMPGRKRSDAPAGGKVEARQPAAGVKSSNSPRPVIFDAELGRRSAAAAQVCAIKSQGYQSALDLLKEGFARLAEECEIDLALRGLSSAGREDGFPSSPARPEEK